MKEMRKLEITNYDETNQKLTSLDLDFSENLVVSGIYSIIRCHSTICCASKTFIKN